MARKTPSINLLSGKKHICHFCKNNLIFKSKTFLMHQNKGNKTISVTEKILFCPKCNLYYISQAMSYEIVKKYPGYYIDLSTYKIKHKSKSNTKKHTGNQQIEEKHLDIHNEAKQTR